MKNPINLLLTLSIPFVLTNCSAKPQHAKLPVKIQNNRPSLGTPIYREMPNRNIPIAQTPRQMNTRDNRSPQNIPRRVKAPVVEQRSKYGESYVSNKFKLPHSIDETSGLIKVDNRLWTLNDSGGKAALYQIDERNGRIVKTLKIDNAFNRDWEDIAYDDNYVYIGDIGNNRGTRKDLKVYKIPRTALRTQNSVRAEIIHFTYSDQRDFRSKPHKNNYDCEAMIAHNGKLYLFSKNWQNQKTRLYSLSTRPGKHTAQYLSTFNTQSMVTGATINKELNILLLSTYSSLLNVNFWVFTNFHDDKLFSGESKQLKLKSPLQGQVEGITFINNYKAYISSEAFKKYIFSLDARLFELNFSGEFE